MIGSRTQRHTLPMLTPAAILTGIGRIDSYICPASFCRFAGEFAEKFRPRCIMNALGQTMVMRHAVDLQIFHTDDTETINDLATSLMGEVVPFEPNMFMHTCHNFAVLASLRCSLRKSGMLALDLCQCLFLFPEETRILDLLACGEGRKGCESNVDPNLSTTFRKTLGFTLNREASVPFARRGMMDGERLDLAAYRAMIDHLDAPDLGEADAIIMGDGKAGLWEGEAVIAVPAFEAWIARVLGMFSRATKKGLEGQVNPYCDVLQHL